MDTLVRLPALQQDGVNQHSPAEVKSPSSARCLTDAKMFTRVASKAGRLVEPAMHRCVVMGPRHLRKAKDQMFPMSPPAFLPVTDEVIRWHLQVIGV